METQQYLQTAEEILKEWTLEVKRPEENRIDVYINAANILSAVKALLIDNKWGYLSAITGMDSPEYRLDTATNEKTIDPEKGSIEILYHFSNQAAVTSIRVQLPYSNANIESICDLIPSASFYEREVVEMLGVNIINTPLTDNLILPDTWPAGVYPLRKAFKGFEKSQG